MLASTLITIALAEYASRDDFHQIGKWSKIRHGIQWLFRAAVVGLACYLDNCLLYAVPLAFLFSAVFRWRLNGLRGKDWRYVSPSNWYDWMFMGFDLSLQGRPHWAFGKRRASINVHEAYWKPNNFLRQDYVHHVHRAGTLAYIFEAVVFVVGTAWYIWA